MLTGYSGLIAQRTVVSGKVTDAITGESIPFATLFFKGTKTGGSTDIDGNYRIETYYSSDSLSVLATGYATQSKFVKEGTDQIIDFSLSTKSVELNTIVIRPDDGPNPAIALIKKVLRNKKINNREKLDAYEYEAYNKVEFDLNNINENFQKRKIFKLYIKR